MQKSTTLYKQALSELADWEPYLRQESHLPGPRGNLELAQVVAEIGNHSLFERLIAYEPHIAPTNTPGEFLCFCGVLGLGRLVSEGQFTYLTNLRSFANDPRWRVREAVAMALQWLGKMDMERLLHELETWRTGSWLEKRAAAAALAEPALLHNPLHTRCALQILDGITISVASAVDRNCESFKTLRQGLGYCWSVIVAALPEDGKAYMEKWLLSQDRDIVWIMRENLKKKRLERMDGQWVEYCLSQLAR